MPVERGNPSPAVLSDTVSSTEQELTVHRGTSLEFDLEDFTAAGGTLDSSSR